MLDALDMNVPLHNVTSEAGETQIAHMLKMLEWNALNKVYHIIIFV